MIELVDFILCDNFSVELYDNLKKARELISQMHLLLHERSFNGFVSIRL